METLSNWHADAWSQITKKVASTSLRIGDGFPHASVEGKYKLEPASWWTAGFWPGLL
ncbi:glycosyl hydrolase, partial [Paenibacillus sp. MCAF20]